MLRSQKQPRTTTLLGSLLGSPLSSGLRSSSQCFLFRLIILCTYSQKLNELPEQKFLSYYHRSVFMQCVAEMLYQLSNTIALFYYYRSNRFLRWVGITRLFHGEPVGPLIGLAWPPVLLHLAPLHQVYMPWACQVVRRFGKEGIVQMSL